MTQIHPSAIISSNAQIADSASIGPYCVVGDKVKIAAHVKLHSHVCIDGDTTIGEATEIFPFASIGHVPQDKKYGGEHSHLEIGAHTIIREHVTMNPGTQGGGLLTKVGNHCLFMVGAHVAHDCIIGNHVILANNATLAGHVTVGDGVIIGGLAAVHQFVRIGAYSMIGGTAGVAEDVIPYGTVLGDRGYLAGLNLIGLKRRNIDKDNINKLRHVYKAIFNSSEGTLMERAQAFSQTEDSAEVHELIAFILSDKDRSLCTPPVKSA